jgi:tyrocidine synthetase-3
MKIEEIIKELQIHNVTPKLEKEQLKLVGATDQLSKEFIEAIKTHRHTLIGFLKESSKRLSYEAIDTIAEQEYYPASGAQKRIWILNQLEGAASAYHIISSFHLQGVVQNMNLNNAFQSVIERHESLRTIFKEVDGELRQYVLNKIDFKIEEKDFTKLQDVKKELETEINKSSNSSFQLDRGPLLRVKLIQFSKKEYALILAIHHIISDGWSVSVLMKEVMDAYRSFCTDQHTTTTPLRIQYKDYSNWIHRKFSGDAEALYKKYWTDRFGDQAEILQLPLDFSRPDSKTYNGALCKFYFNKKLHAGIQAFCKNNSTTLFNFLHATLTVLLYKYSGQRKMVLGTPVAGRNHSDLEHQIGLYVNTIALQTELKPEQSFLDYLKQTTKNAQQDFEYQDYPFDKLVEALNIERDLSRNPIFDVMIVLQNTAYGDGSIDVSNHYGFELSFLDTYLYKRSQPQQRTVTSKFDLTFNFLIEPGNNFCLELEYNSDIFKDSTAEQFVTHFKQLLSAILVQPQSTIHQLDFLNLQEKKKLLLTFNDSAVAYPKEKTIAELVEEQAALTPDAVAIKFQELTLTYGELNSKANQLAGYLKENHKIKANDLIAIKLERSEWLIISILAVLKSGAAYVPVDPTYPQERIDYMLSDSKSKMLIDEEALEKFKKEERKYTTKNLKLTSKSDDLVYVIYTSGSTGQPKGVMIMQHSFTNLVKWYAKLLELEQRDSVLLIAPVSFDLAQKNIFAPLITGASLCLPQESHGDYEALIHTITRHQVSVVGCAPSAFYPLLDVTINDRYKKLSSLKKIPLGGEPIVVKQFLPWVRSGHFHAKLINTYGPTECTDIVSYYEVKADEWNTLKTIPIGMPVDNVKLYVLNDSLQLLPIGATGEIFISGVGVGLGYLNKPELTAEKFIANPFEKGLKMFRTGDLGKRLPDGNIQFIGRKDDQVKIRGFRVELGEIENAIRTEDRIDAVLVAAKVLSTGEKELVAYIVSNVTWNASTLTEYLSQRLPAYMIPSHFVQMERLPLTPSGKIDRKKLPEPEGLGMSTGIAYQAPTTEIEEKLVSVWEELLGREQIGIKDDFFKAGGHSLKAMRLTSLIHQTFNVRLELKSIFANPVLQQQAQLIQQATKTTYTAIPLAAKQTGYPLAAAQRRIWILDQLEAHTTVYNMPGIYAMQGALDLERLERTFQALVQRQEILRTSFEMQAGEVVQIIHPEIDFKITRLPASDFSPAGFSQPFDLDKAPLFRVSVISENEHNHLLAVDMHHIISDGVSVGMLIQEFTHLYNGITLEPLRIQYKDFASWQQTFLASEVMQQQRKFWIGQFSGELAVLELPTDFTRPLVQNFEGATLHFTLEESLLKQLKATATETGTTMYMLLFSAYAVLLSKYTGQDDIVIGTPVAGRPHADLQQLIGMFVNTVAIRNYPKADKDFHSFLLEVKEQLLNAFENQDFPFEELVEALQVKRDMSRNPLFDVMFSYQNSNMLAFEIEGMQLKNVATENRISKFDLSLDVIETDGQLEMSMEYYSGIFKKESIERLISHYKKIISELLENPYAPLSAIDMLTKQEKHQLLTVFNNTHIAYPSNKTVLDLFEEQALIAPANIALSFENNALTYKQLNEKSNQVARALESKGVAKDAIVGIMMEPGFEMIIGLLAILKTGAAYLPIDIHYPAERIDFMLKDCAVNYVLVNGTSPAFGSAIKSIDLQDKKLYTGSSANLRSAIQANQLAYVTYTSGSTGTPKGVMIEHSNLFDYVNTFIQLTGITASDTALLNSSISFDTAIEELFPALCVSGKVLINKDNQDLGKVLDFISRKKISILSTSPLVINYINEEAKSFGVLRTLISGGDVLKPSYITNIPPQVAVYNSYGPTESTVCITYNRIENKSDATLSIGKPIANRQVYILDANLNLLPAGIPGELCVGGKGVARGYLNREALTNEKFVSNPFVKGERIYKTGDLAKWLPDGSIEFIGRIDQQVKIRGFRIELGEIENKMQELSEITQALVIARNDHKEANYLCAYFVAEEPIGGTLIREFLRTQLPEYMIPAFFIQIDVIPMTLNGKVNKKALPSPEQLNVSSSYVAPTNETEEQLVRIWEQVLDRKKIGITDDFFNIGGHSLKAMRLVSQIHHYFEVKLELRSIFINPILEQQAKLIQQAKKNSYKAIPVANHQDSYPLSSAQRRLWILSQFEEGNVAYNMPGVFIFHGQLDKSILQDAFNELIERHEILRTVFRENEEGEIRQFIQTSAEISFTIGYEELLSGTKQEQLKHVINSTITTAFDLATGPLLRVNLYPVSEQEWIFVYVMHHIISDGWSMDILIKEVLAVYNARIRNESTAFAPMRIQYKDYASWQQQQLTSADMEIHRSYWLKQLEGPLPILELQGDQVRPSVKTYNGGIIHKHMDAALVTKIRAIARQQGSTLFMSLLAAVNTLLYKYTSQEDIIIGTPAAGREHTDLEDQIGFYINTLALRTKLNGTDSYNGLLAQTKQLTLEAYEHQRYPFDELVEALKLGRDISRSALFDVMIVLQNTGDVRSSMYPDVEGLTLKNYEGETTRLSKFDLLFDFAEQEDALQLNLEYNRDIYHKDTIIRLADHFEQLLQVLLMQPEQPINQLEFISAKEKHILLTEFNNTAAAYPADKTIIGLFEEQVTKHPDKIALAFQEKEFSYSELNAEANQLAAYLRNTYTIKTDDLIVVKLERSEWMMISILAILKSGGAYVPVDPTYPQDRIDYMIEDSKSKVVIDEEELKRFRKDKNNYSDRNESLLHTPGSLVYVIYTSGSTGRPKGCMLENKGVVNRIEWMWKQYGFNSEDVILQKTTFTFDVSVWEIFMPLCWGTKMVLCEKGDIGSPELLMQLIHRHNVTCLHFVPSMFNVFITALQENAANKQLLASLTKVMTSGEALTVETVKKWYERMNAPVHNLYGPTEASVDVTYYTTSIEDTSIPIGKPIWNTQMYVLNEAMQVLPIGVAGEIYIGGDGLARGYLNKKELTAEKFVINPFKKEERIYKTGDVGRWLADGNMAYIGRKDDQVKIRGYRIELGEIENALQSHALVESSVVIAKANASGEKELIAYIVGKTTLSSQELRNHLSRQLPAYMIPGYYLQLETMPLTSSGKVDRKLLPAPEGLNMASGVEYLAPRNETETKLVSIWEQLLDRKKIGVRDDFFALGGHSLKATQLLSQVHKTFQVKLDLRDLFVNTTPELQAQLIRKCEKTNYISIEKSILQNDYALSSAQKRLFFLQQLALNSTSYNMPYIDFLGKNVNKERISAALKELVNRHESFRTSFETKDGIVRQKIQEIVDFELDEHHCSLGELNDHLTTYIRAFDLSKAPLLRSALVDVQDIGYVWIIDMHHIISDGTSNQVLIDDFMQLYKGEQLPALRIQYRDFSEWQNTMLEKGELELQKNYWLSQFAEGIPVLNFPTDRARPASFTFEGGNFEFTLDGRLTKQLKDFCKQQQSTLQMALLSVLNILLYKYTGQEEMVVGCGTAGRRHVDVERIVGMFVNTFAIRSTPKGNKKFDQFYKEVISSCIGAYENQDIQFEDLVDILKVERDPSRNPIFDIGLVVQNVTRSKNNLAELFGAENDAALNAVVSQWKNEGTSKFDMVWFVTEGNEDIAINLEYYSAIFDRSTIERVANHFTIILNTILATPDILISQINMLPEQEQEQLLSFNKYAAVARQTSTETFHSLFEKQSLLTPADVAVTEKDKSYTYKELNERANQLAHFLRTETNIQKEDKVGVLQSRAVELIVSILGILKAGGTYVPLDGKHPETRLLYMLEDAGISTLLTEKNVIEFANRLQWRSKGLKHLVCMDSENIYGEEGLWKNDMMRKDLWDHVGSTAEDAIAGGGWMSSYTGEYLSEAEMNEYSRNAYLKLKPHLNKTMNVLEIGCSSGLTMFEIAKEVGAYHGTDLSSTIIANTGRVAQEKGFTNITLSCLPAHEIDQVQGENFDLVIINSVLQSFHGHNYLRDVLVKAIGKMKVKGLLFIGDIMDEDKREALIQDLHDFRQENRHKAYRTKTDLSAELFISRDYLNDLISDQIGMVDADYSDKIHTIANELTRFRFDALIHIDQGTKSKTSVKKKQQHDLKKINSYPVTDPGSTINPDDLAYVIYTSGSTGKPKGVMITHESIVSFLDGCRNKFSFNKKIVLPLLASHAFDISLFETFLPLVTGGRVHMIDEEHVKDIPHLANELKTVNAFHAVPALMAQIIAYITGANAKQEYEAIEDLFIGGDAVPTNILEEMRMVFPKARVHTLYGPTESTIFITTKQYATDTIQVFKGSLLGKPNANAKIYITDSDQNLMPLGAIGELCVSGKAVAKGYLNNEELTAEKFIRNPFDENERIYRTGDLGKWNATGELEFVGRMDSQVKVRGFRIELGEIENNLEKQEDVNRAIVLPKKDADGSNYLVAYVEKKKRIKLTPSLSEYFVYDDIAYHAMTTDEKRNFHYKQAFNKVLKNKVVLDIGTGPDAILSQFAVLAGAKKVYAVEILEETYLKAKKRIAELGLENKITLIHGDITKIELPEKAEYCISEIVGAVGGSEGAAKLINEARRFLTDPSNMLPKRSLTKIAAVYLPDELHQFSFDEVSAYYMQKIVDQVGYMFDLRMCVEHLTSEHVITNHQPFEDLDFTAPIQLEETHTIKLVFEKDSIVNGFVVWLNLYIDEHQLIDTLAERYIWLPVYLPVFYNDTQVKQGDYIEASIERKLASNGLNPDFIITGTLHRQAGESIDFNFVSSNTEAAYKGSPFYQKLFENDRIQIREDVSATTLRKYLKDKLPEYMIPSAFVLLNELPLSSNDKVDRKALAKFGTEEIQFNKELIAPRTGIEEQLVAMWKELLGKEQISVTDNFFEIGGHSLKATRLASHIHKAFDVKVELKDLFLKPILEQQAALIQQSGKISYTVIPVLPKATAYAISSSQRRLWILSQFKEGTVAYNMPGVYTLNGLLNRAALEDAFAELINRHESLRTVFKEEETGTVTQIIQTAADSGFKIDYLDLRNESAQTENIRKQIRSTAMEPFDLVQGPLIRATLYQVSDTQWVFLYVMHHIISDGWSMDILIQELLQFYNSAITGNVHTHAPLRIQYKEYASWQQEQLKGEALQTQKKYWLNQLGGSLPVLDLQGDQVRPKIKTYNGETIYTTLNATLTHGLRSLSKEQGGTLFMSLLAAVNTLLYRYTGQEDLIIGTVIAGRDHVDLEDQIGFYLNTLALRTQFKGSTNFKELLQQVKQVTLDAYAHQLYPFDELVDALDLQRDMSRNPLFDVSVVLQNATTNKIGAMHQVNDLQVSMFEDAQIATSKFDLSFDFIEDEKEIRTGITFNTDIYAASSIRRLMAHFEQLLQVLISKPEQAIRDLDYLSETERQQLLEVFNDTKVSYPKEKTIVHLFEEQVTRTPHNIAVAFEEHMFTYQELNERSNKLAAYLINHYDIHADDLVGILLDRSEWMIISILAILKSGGAYVPMDTSYPQSRIDYMIQDSNCKVVLTNEELTTFKNEEHTYATTNVNPVAKSNNLAYVIYTSGTTGNPKGSLIEHKNVIRLFENDKRLFDFTDKDVWTMFHSYCFDFSVWEMYGALLYGGKVVIVPALVAKDADVYLDLLKREGVTILNQTPSAFYNIIKEELKKEDAVLKLRYVIFGGEALSPGKLEEWRKKYPKTKLINMYGITETTVHVTYKEITEKEIEKGISNIGTAIPTLSCYVLDPFQKLLPIGIPGELYVGGEGLARGYLNRQELTEQRFIPHPFRKGELLYRSGDKARILENGELEYLGRVDDQVKIRGYRIEIGEIENALQYHPSIETAVVIAKQNESGEKDLVAYIVGKETLTIQEIRNYLSAYLPAYMLPGYYVQLNELPLTANGKIDKKKLPKPDGMGMSTGVEYVAPRNAVEKKLVAIWEELLGKEGIGIRDNFFEIGGHSLKVNRLIAQLRKEYKTEIDLKTVFMEPTIEVLADKISNDLWLQDSLVEDDTNSNEIKI